jgi:methylated-DNA-[protein]-cysteine S-methyltransferase
LFFLPAAVPCGTTASYGEIARALGKPDASRAVGAANARNPVALVVPCHRVVGADGSLTGYAGGRRRKRWLLAHEGVKLLGGRLARSARVADHDLVSRFASTRRTSAVATVS